MIEVSDKKFSTQNPSSSNNPKLGRPTMGKNWALNSHIWQPPTDVYETEKVVIVLVEIAGMRESEFVISLEKRTLVISGHRNHNSEAGAYHQMEIMSGDFISVVELPVAVQYENIKADYIDGFLKIELPKNEIVRVVVKNKKIGD